MNAPRLISAAHRALTLVVLLAVVLLSMGHRHDVTSEPLDPAVAAFVASGGQLSDLCDLSDGSDTGLGAHCPACVLGQDIDVPIPAVLACKAPEAVDQADVGQTSDLIGDVAFDFSRTSRAPPVL